MIQNLIYGTGGDSSQSFKSTLHERVNIDTTQVLVDGVPELGDETYSSVSNIDIIERDLSMYNIETVQVWANASSQTDITPMLKAQIDKLPLWNECCIESTQSPYYQPGDIVMETRYLPYKFSKYGINIQIMPFFVFDAYQPWYVTTGSTSNDMLWTSPIDIKAWAPDITYWNNLKPTILYLAKSSTSNGLWTMYPSTPEYGTCKIFVTTCINEDDGTIGYRPIVATNGTSRSSKPSVCYTYAFNGYYVDMTSWSLGKPGYSGSLVLKQVRILNYLFPDLYIISGGLSKINQDIVHIDNNTYIHLCNDIFIKIK